MQGVSGGAGGRGRGRVSPGRSGPRFQKVGTTGHGHGWRQNGGPRYPPDMDAWSDSGAELQPERSKRLRSNTGGEGTATEVNLVEFDSMNVDEKLSTMMRKLSQLDDIKTTLKDINMRVNDSTKDVHEIREKVDVIDDRLKYVEYRTIDLEARSRRSNLLFFGFQEDVNESCEVGIREFLKHKMHIAQGETMCMQRVHRLGKVKHTTRSFTPRPRPIIIAFRDYTDVDLIMKSVGVLKGTGYSVSRDYPTEINEARKKLSPLFKQAKENRQTPKVMYPAKLIIDQNVVRDEFPDWNRVLYQRSMRTRGTISVEAPPTIGTEDRDDDRYADERDKSTQSRSPVSSQKRAPPVQRSDRLHGLAPSNADAPPTSNVTDRAGEDDQRKRPGDRGDHDAMSTNQKEEWPLPTKTKPNNDG